MMSVISGLMAAKAAPPAATRGGAQPEGTGQAGGADFLQQVTSNPLIMALIPAVMMAPRGFEIMSHPQLLADPAVRIPILRHVLMTGSVQNAIMALVAESSGELAKTIGMPKGMSEAQEAGFYDAIELAVEASVRDYANLYLPPSLP